VPLPFILPFPFCRLFLVGSWDADGTGSEGEVGLGNAVEPGAGITANSILWLTLVLLQ
jgi:hypothetical protein